MWGGSRFEPRREPLAKLIDCFRFARKNGVQQLKEMIKDVQHQPEILVGDEGAVEVARHKDAEAVVTGIVGCAGLLPTVAAIKAGKDICLANKETLIAGRHGCSAVASATGGEYGSRLRRFAVTCCASVSGREWEGNGVAAAPTKRLLVRCQTLSEFQG